MAELQLWKGFLERDDVQDLDPVDRLALISIGVEVADNLPDVDGYLPRSAVRRVPWSSGTHELVEAIDRLVASGFLEDAGDRNGWIITNWLTTATYFKPGNAATKGGWGQNSSAHWKGKRQGEAKRQKEWRDRQKAKREAELAAGTEGPF